MIRLGDWFIEANKLKTAKKQAWEKEIEIQAN